MKNSFLIVPLFITGCAGATITTLKPSTPRPENCEIEVFGSEAEIKREYESLCLVEAQTGTAVFDDRTLGGAIAVAKPKLCECGAEAAVIMAGRSAGDSLFATSLNQVRGSVVLKGIRFKDSESNK